MDKQKRKRGKKFLWSRDEVLVWICVYLFLFMGGISHDALLAVVSSGLIVSGMVSVSLINRVLLIPHLLKPHRYFLYYIFSALLLIVSIALFAIIDSFLMPLLVDDIPSRNDAIAYSVFKYSVFFISSFAYGNIAAQIRNNREMTKHSERLLNEKKDMELRMLRSQINPHFLFNALNNIYSMVYTQDENAPDSILKLSEMLRYVVDDCQSENVFIEKEINYIENFIDFQLMRMEGEQDISFVKEVNNPKFKFPPMILQPFVENCFKYSRIGSVSGAYIHITLALTDTQLMFTTRNSKAVAVASRKNSNTGIGIANVRQRLELSFPQSYKLEITDMPDYYQVELSIRIGG